MALGPSGRWGRRRRLRRAKRRSGGLIVVLAALVASCLSTMPGRVLAKTSTEPGAGAEAGHPIARETAPRLEAGLSVSLAMAGASNAYLRPGNQEPEATGMVSGRTFVGLRGRRLGVRLTYAPGLQQYVVGGVRGVTQGLDLNLSCRPTPSLLLDTLLFGGLAAYDSVGPTVDGTTEGAGTLQLVATRSRAMGVGAGLRYDPKGPLGARAATLASLRSSHAVLAQEATPAPVEEIFLEAGASVVWRPVRRVEMTLGPVAERRSADREHLSYRGMGLQAASTARAWKGGGLELSVRGQHNVFGGPLARSDVFARASLVAWQEVGGSFRLSARYVYTANGSAVAAYDADRHLLIVVLSVRTPTWRR